MKMSRGAHSWQTAQPVQRSWGPEPEIQLRMRPGAGTPGHVAAPLVDKRTGPWEERLSLP